MTEAKSALIEQIESSLYLFFMFLNSLQLEYNNYKVQSVKSTLQNLFDDGFFDGFDKKDEILKKFVIFNRRQWGEVETGKQ